MKIIKKITDDGYTMYFEKMTRNDVKELIADWYSDEYALNELKDSDDEKIVWELDDGAIGFFDELQISKRPAIARIKKLRVENGGASVGFFGKGIEIVKNEHGVYELEGF